MHVDREFQNFFRLGYPKVVATLRQMGFEREQSADSASEAMIQLYASSKQVNNPLAWVMTVAFRDAARNIRRANTGLKKLIIEAGGKPESTRDDDVGLSEDNILDVLKMLTPAQRQVITLYYQEYKTSEIAQILGTDESTVRRHRLKVRARLQDLIENPRTDVSGEPDEFLSLLQSRGVFGRD